MARRRRTRPRSVAASAPCRLDCGGTLDIGPLALGLAAHAPATFNLALALRTEVEVVPLPAGDERIIIESQGFEPVVAAPGRADYTGPLGFFFLAVDRLGLGGLNLAIRSASPPQSALGGSSAALTAAVAALSALAGRKISRWEAVALAHQLEEALFGIPCGRQDHLAAAYGGVNRWTWAPGYKRGYKRRQLLKAEASRALARRLVIAYPGQTHASVDINGRWLADFRSGTTRAAWLKIIQATHDLCRAIELGDWPAAARALNQETDLRLELTPEVLTDLGRELVAAARKEGVGGRFTGAGGGGCVYALGPRAGIDRLRPIWREILAAIPAAALLPSAIDRRGLVVTPRF